MRKIRLKWCFPVMLIVCLETAVFSGRSACAAENWQVKEAPIRFTVSLADEPTQPTCGYFMQLPDGGILPGPFPLTQIFDQDGHPVPSYALWQNQETGVGIVFEKPAAGQRVYIYVTPSAQLKTWTSASGLTPSAIICTYPGTGARFDALKLANFGRVMSSVHYRNQARSQDAGLALPGDRSGRPGPTAMYMLAYLVTRDPGPTWLAPKSYGGEMEFIIDGQKIVPVKVNEKPGGVGQMVNLKEGLHRLDAFAWAAPNGASGLIFLMMRTPKSTIEELGGKRPDDLKYPGTAMLEGRHLRDEEIARSGSCKIEKIETADGGPVANFSIEIKENFWFGEETPLVLCNLSALSAGNPENTEYLWSFSSHAGALARGAKVPWLFPGGKFDCRVTLKAVRGDKQSVCTVPFYPFTEARSSLEHPATREGFRAAALAMLSACQTNADPVAKWDVSMWNNLFRNLDLGEGIDLLAGIFRRWDVISKKLPDDRRELLEEMFFFTIPRADPKEAIRWAELLSKDASSKTKPAMMKLRSAEILMYYLRDYEGAKKILRAIAEEGGDVGELAKIRLGDAGFLSRNMNEATQFYGDVQNRAKYASKAAEAAPKKAVVPTGLARNKKEFDAQHKVEAKPVKPASSPNEPLPSVVKWKEDAIRDVAASETVKNLIEQKYYLEAYRELKRWERVFPLSKISGDYFLSEAKLYMAVHDYGRARIVLEAYCDQVDASNFMGEALTSIKTCMVNMKESDADVEKFLEKVRKRMKFSGKQF